MLVCVGALGVGCAHHAWLAVDGRLPADAAARTNAPRDAAILPSTPTRPRWRAAAASEPPDSGTAVLMNASACVEHRSSSRS